jgi:hypothetical protein
VVISGSHLLTFLASYEHYFFLVRFLSLFLFSAVCGKVSKLENIVKDLNEHHSMKIYEGVEVYGEIFLTSALDGDK